MREKQVTFENYAQKLQLGGSRSIPESEVGPHLVDIFRSTFEKLGQNARELMQLCSFIENTNIPIKLLKGREGLYVFDWMKGRIRLPNVCAPRMRQSRRQAFSSVYKLLDKSSEKEN